MGKYLLLLVGFIFSSGIIFSTEVDVLEEAKKLRSDKDRGSYSSELETLRILGLSASDAVSFINSDNLSSLYIKKTPEESRSSATKLFQNSWRVNSKYKFFKRLNERYYGGLREEYIKVLELIASRDDINHSIEELTLRDNWKKEFSIGDMDEDAFFNLTFLAYNSHLISYRDIEIFELERLSTFIKWGFSLNYLSLEDANFLLEDLALALLNYGGDWKSLGESYVSGIALLFGDKNYFKTALRRRSTAVLDLLKRGVWEDTSWEIYYSLSRDLLEKGILEYPNYMKGNIVFPTEPSGLDPKLKPLFNRNRESHSILDIYQDDYDLFYYIDTDNFEGVADTLEGGRIFDDQLHNGPSYITHAIGKDHRIFKLLLENGYNPDLRNTGNKVGAIHYAASNKDSFYLEKLIAYGADINLIDGSDRTPIGHAIKYNNYNSLDTLLKSGADPNIGYIGNYSPLGSAIRDGKNAIALRVIEEVDDINQKGIDDWYLIHLAVRYGSVDIVEALVDKGADLTLQTEAGYTPLHLAVLNSTVGRNRIIQSLINSSDNLDVKNKYLRSPLDEYLNEAYYEVNDMRQEDGLNQFKEEEGFAENLDYLLSFGFSLKGVDSKGRNPLWYLRRYGSREQIEAVIDHVRYSHGGAGYDIGFALIKRDLRDTFKKFVSKNVENINHRIDSGYNLTYFAFTNPDYFWAGRILLDAGADIDIPGYNDYHILTAMAISGHYEELVYVLDRGGDITLIDGNRKVAVGEHIYQTLKDVNREESFMVIDKLIEKGLVVE